MKFKNPSLRQEIRASVANKLTLPLIVLEKLKNNQKVNKGIIIKAINDLKGLTTVRL